MQVGTVGSIRQAPRCEAFQRGIERPVAQHFILQMLVALFAEDILRLPEIEVELPFTDIYADVQLPPQSDDAAASGPSGSL